MYYEEFLEKLGFYHMTSESIYQTDYTEEPRGDFDVDQLIKGDSKIWKNTILTPSSTHLKKKILVINDWAATHTACHINHIIDWFNDGFETYIVQDNKLVKPLTEDELLTALFQTRFIPHHELLALMTAQGLSVDETKIVDYFTIQKILWRTDKYNIINLSDMETKLRLDEFQFIIKNTNLNNVGLNFKDCLPLHPLTYKVLQIIQQYCVMSYVEINFDDLEDEDIILSLIKLSHLNLTHVKMLSVRGTINTAIFFQFLAACSNIQHLSLIRTAELDYIAFPQLSQLDSLVLQDCDMPFDSHELTNILEKCPELKVLDLSNVHQEISEIELKAPLRKLTKVFLKNGHTASVIQNAATTILVAPPSIFIIRRDEEADLYLSGFPSYYEVSDFRVKHNPRKLKFDSTYKPLEAPITLSPNRNITILSLCKTKIEAKDIASLLCQLPQLITLSFKEATVIGKQLTLNFELKYLTWLCLNESEIDKIFLSLLLDKCPQLTSIKDYYLEKSDNDNPGAHNAQSSDDEEIDGDTEYVKNNFVVEQYFEYKYDNYPHPCNTRLNVLIEEEDKVEPVEITNIPFMGFEALQNYYHVTFKDKPHYYHGIIALQGIKRHYLPGLNPNNETIVCLATTAPVRLFYNLAKNMHQVQLIDKSDKYNVFNVEYILHSLPSPILNDQTSLAIKDRCSSFSEGKLKGIKDNSNESEIIDAIIKQEKGACRHRVAAYRKLARDNNIKIRRPVSKPHIWIDVFYNNKWHSIDLGGYRQTLEILSLEVTKELDALDCFILEANSSVAEIEPFVLESKELDPDNPFITWNTEQENNCTSYEDYIEWLFAKTASSVNRTLFLKFSNEAQLELFNIALMNKQQAQHRNHFYVADLNKMTRNGLILDPDNNYERGNSDVVEYLKNAKEDDVIVMKCFDYKSEHIGLNSLLEKKRRYVDVSVSNNVIIIWALSLSVAEEFGEDFYSRGQDFEVPLTLNGDHLRVKPEVTPLSTEQVINRSVNLYDGLDWQPDLVGRLVLSGKQLALNKGKLIDAVEQDYDLPVINAPLDDPEFRYFYQSQSIKGSFKSFGRNYSLARQNILSFYKQSYPVPKIHETNDPWQCPLNYQTYAYFFKAHNCHSHAHYEQAGWLESHRDRSLRIGVTEKLDNASLAKFAAKALEVNCNITLISVKEKNPENFTSLNQLKQISVILSNDPAYTRLFIRHENQHSIYIPITPEMQYGDIIEKTVRQEDGTLLGQFAIKNGITVSLLKRYKLQIIFQGNFSDNLPKSLETLNAERPFLWLNGQPFFIPEGSQIIFIMPESAPVSFHAATFKHHVQAEEYWPHLSGRFTKEIIEEFKNELALVKPYFQPTNYIQYFSLLEGKRNKPGKNYFKPFLLLEKNPLQLIEITNSLFKQRIPSPLKLEGNITHKRLNKLKQALDNHSHVFIVGDSATGKSTLILEELQNFYWEQYGLTVTLFVWMKKFKEWLTSSDNTDLTILVAEELNLGTPHTFDILEGFYNGGFAFEDQFYPLKPHHKFIGLGNFSNYVNRQQPQFFKDHGSVLHFKPFSRDFLTHGIIEPILGKFKRLNSDEMQECSKMMLDVYEYINSCDLKFKLTPRNLQMMCLRQWLFMDKSWKESKNTFSLFNCSMAIEMELAGFTLSEEVSRELMMRFHLHYQAIFDEPFPSPNFTLTESRKLSFELMREHLAIRNLKLKYPELSRYGLNGMLIEGPSGIGKTLMIEEFLIANNYVNGFTCKNPKTSSQRKYYVLTPTNYDEMVAICLKAFHEGSILIINELNSMALEALLNQLMSGYDLEGKKAKIPGFFVFSTQNPISFKKRLVQSFAQDNRSQKVNLPEYPENELSEITEAIGLSHDEAIHRSNQFWDARAYGLEHNKRPLPTPRNLFRFAENIVKNRQPEKTGTKRQIVELEDLEQSSAKRSKVSTKMNAI